MAESNLYVVAVTGGRDFDNWKLVDRVLSEIHATRQIDILVHGGCSGADEISNAWAVSNLVQTAVFRVTERMWSRIGRSAGPSRNLLMLECTHPNLLVAFPGGDGTNGCVRIGNRLKIELRDERNSK